MVEQRDGNVMPDEATSDLEGSGSWRQRWEIIVLAMMYVGYAALMLCRNTLITASATMTREGFLNKATYGRLMSLHSAGSIAGKIVTGVGADRIGGRRMFLLALALTAAANAAFGMTSSLLLLGSLNFLGQFFKSGGWPAMAKIIGEWYSKKKHGRVWSIISTSSRVGTIAAGLIVGFLLSLISWRAVFTVSALVTGFVVIPAWFWLKERPADVGLASPEEEQPEDEGDVQNREPHPLDGTTLPQACLVFAGSVRVWLICLSLTFLTILMDFVIFVPIYLNEALEIDPDRAGMAMSIFPAGMFVALVVTSALYDRLSKRQLVLVLGGLLGMSCLCVLLLWNLGNLPLPPQMNLPVAMAAIFAFGFTVAPAYYVPMSVFSIAFGGKHSGFLISLIDVFGYVGSMVFTFFGGSIAADFGWPVFLTVLLTITALALVTVTAFLFMDARATDRSRSE